jgi:NitT/TauT family transport system substrate-binding protein
MERKTRALWLVLALLLSVSSRAAAAEKLTFQMAWIFGGEYIAFFVARDKGFFEKNGLDVTILKGAGSLKSATFVDAKQADFSYGDFLTAIQVMAKGGKNRAIGVGQVFQTGAYIFLERSGIKKPKDLEGKRFGTTPADVGNVLLAAMAVTSGFDHKKVIINIMDPAVRTPALFEGKVDFIAGLRGSSVPRMRIIAKREGKKVDFLYFKDMGLETYGQVLQTHEDRIKNNPDQVRRFVAAVFDAWAWSIKNPNEALEIFMKANPESDRESSMAQILEGLSDVQEPETKQRGLGYMKDEMVKKSVEIANKYFNLSPPVDYRITYTNQFVRKNPGM